MNRQQRRARGGPPANPADRLADLMIKAMKEALKQHPDDASAAFAAHARELFETGNGLTVV
jgi:hypothetical protein